MRKFFTNSKTKRRTLLGAATALLTGIGIVMGATSAQAATTYDYLANPIYSAGAASGAMANNGGTGGYIVSYDPGFHMYVASYLTDLVADGYAPTLRIHITSTLSDHYYELRNLDGKGTEKLVTGTYAWPGGSGQAIQFQVCNGKSSTGANLYCGQWTGYYHP